MLAELEGLDCGISRITAQQYLKDAQLSSQVSSPTQWLSVALLHRTFELKYSPVRISLHNAEVSTILAMYY
jgi:hypothetical protein